MIDFGKTRTSLIIFSGYSIRFTTTIPISSQKLTESIAESLKVDLPEAEKLKLKHGLEITERKREPNDSKKTVRRKIFEAMVPALTDLTGQIKRYVNYYQSHADRSPSLSNGKRIEKILLCGRGANLKGLLDFFSFELKIRAELGNPWINILPQPLREVPEISFEESLGYTTALGLALRGVEEE